jgi:hypothetical protein
MLTSIPSYPSFRQRFQRGLRLVQVIQSPLETGDGERANYSRGDQNRYLLIGGVNNFFAVAAADGAPDHRRAHCARPRLATASRRSGRRRAVFATRRLGPDEFRNSRPCRNAASAAVALTTFNSTSFSAETVTMAPHQLLTRRM